MPKLVIAFITLKVCTIRNGGAWSIVTKPISNQLWDRFTFCNVLERLRGF